jgi:hypothetical protein
MASEAWTLWHGGGEGQVFFGVCFLPSDFLSPYLSDYTNESLKTNFRFIDPPPKKNPHIFSSNGDVTDYIIFLLSLQCKMM